MTNRAIWFDMDGTIADLYGVPNWLEQLRAENAEPYRVARPLVNMARLARALNRAQRHGATIGVISWASLGASAEYEAEIARAKIEWLTAHLPSVHWDEIHITAYGVAKNEIGADILFDDNADVRREWGEGAHEPSEIFEILATV